MRYSSAMRSLMFGIALSLAAVSGCNSDKAAAGDKAKAEVPAMTMDEVQKGIDAKQLTAVDCNGDRTRKKLGVLPGAISDLRRGAVSRRASCRPTRRRSSSSTAQTLVDTPAMLAPGAPSSWVTRTST